MRVFSVVTAVLLSLNIVPASADDTEIVQGAKQAQTAPVQPDRTPQQADQAREQDRKDAQDVRVGPDWKAQSGGKADHIKRADQPGQEHQTVGQDWRVRPNKDDRR
jgi:hypothetical protein